ncbi:Outer membrane receptor proteins, mostly Fe transport [Parasphingorhabdus marina DSM 22363]|uniref:Outer membrane receptor proteins, mostly Fe transport n=1 Tax=Parasphingorhabdus marina DSM 22363 TaxID=1123272 RepID=A0A1N6GX19_9SPHN|nr:TonB-dependent receptor [Parasphingorhabdus marina]SIO12070.1 Outer membrane receptor proteins, mostly Fe transport [Parasphingorhabdus marina DSM 22363]
MKKQLLTLPLLAASAPVLAQDETTAGAEVLVGVPESIIIVEGLISTFTTDTYSSQTIVVDRNQRLENSLRPVPGLQQFRRSDARSANPTSQGITLRGLGGNASSRALLLLDGVPQADPFGGWISWPGYDALPIASARVQRGGGSGSNGQGALAGTIELVSADVGDRIELGAAYGSRNSVDADLLFGRELGRGQLTISASYARGDGFTPIVASQRGTVDRPAEYEQAGLAVRYVAPVSYTTELQTSVRVFTDDRERGFAFSENHNDGADASIRLVNRTTGDWQWSALGYVQIRNFDVSFGGVAADRNSVNRVFEQFNVPSIGLGGRFEVRPPVGDNAELRIGGDWRHTEGTTNENFFFLDNDTPRRSRRAGGNTSTYGAFVEGSVRAADNLTLTGGSRIDFWSIDDGFRREIELISPFPGSVRTDASFASRSGSEFTARGGIAFNANRQVTLRGAAYLGWRLPTINELFRPFRVGPDATAANEMLTPERVKGAELGLDWNDGRTKFGVTLFYNQLDDAIANVTLDSGPGVFPGVGFVSGAGVFRQRQNLDSVESKGIEIDTRFDLGALVEKLSLQASWSYVDAEVNASGLAAAVDQLRPAQIPEHEASASLDWSQENGTAASISVRYTGSRFEDDQNSRSLDGAFTVDGRLAYAVTEKLLIEGRVENLFDTEVQAAVSSSGIVERAFPRTFWVGLRAKIE